LVTGWVTFLTAAFGATFVTTFFAAFGTLAAAGFLTLETGVADPLEAGREGVFDAIATEDEGRPLPAGAAGFFLALVVAGTFTKGLLSVPDTA
jgi:hypothetical protein